MKVHGRSICRLAIYVHGASYLLRPPVQCLLLRKIKKCLPSARDLRSACNPQQIPAKGQSRRRVPSWYVDCVQRVRILVVNCAVLYHAGNASEPLSVSKGAHVVRTCAFPVQPALHVGLDAGIIPSRSGRRSKVRSLFADTVDFSEAQL